jgi:hypothetical protein
MPTFTRRSFLKTAGVATGAAAVSASPALAAALEPGAAETAPSGPLPAEPIVAVVRDPGRGQVTVLAGTTERTYTDRQLVSRLLRAAARGGARREGVA